MGKLAAGKNTIHMDETLHERADAVAKGDVSKKTLTAIGEIYAQYLSISDLTKVLEHVKELDSVAYLENGLWRVNSIATDPKLISDKSQQHLVKGWTISVMILVNYKFREGCVDGWDFIQTDEETGSAWEAFVTTLLTVKQAENSSWTTMEKMYLIQFLINCYQSLDISAIARTFLKLISMPIWDALSSRQRQIEFEKYPKLERHWQNITSTTVANGEKATKRRKVTSSAQLSPSSTHEKRFIVDLIKEFFNAISEPFKTVKGDELTNRCTYAALFLAFVTDLLNQLPTRRFLQVVLRRYHFLSIVRRSSFVAYSFQWRSSSEVTALKKQLSLLEASLHFAIDSHTGKSLSAREQREVLSTHIQSLQQYAFHDFRGTRLEELAILPVSAIADRKTFASHLTPLIRDNREQINAFAILVGLVADEEECEKLSNDELLEAFLDEYSSSSSFDVSNDRDEEPVYPTELDIWNDLLENSAGLGDEQSDGATTVYSGIDKLIPLLPIRKLGLQFLNMADYLQRNYELFRLEVASNIRDNLETSIKQLDAVRSLTSSTHQTVFRGFSPMATPLVSPLKIVKVSKPALGKTAPALVIAQFEIELNSQHDFKTFDNYQTKEVVFLVTLRATNDEAAEVMGYSKQSKLTENGTDSIPFPEEYGVLYVRGAEIIEVVDSNGVQINEENPVGRGRKRTLKVALDGLQYKKDLEDGKLEAYEFVNVLIRRKPRENNFKAVLDTMTNTWHNANKEEILPSWLHDLFLGYGDPSAATYKSIYRRKQQYQVEVPLLDLFVDGEHALEACASSDGASVTLVDTDNTKKSLSAKDAIGPFTYVEDLKENNIVIQAYHRTSSSSLSQNAAYPVRFTAAQVAAVRSGMCEGLTVVVGPPGTGKTDVAVQLVLNLYQVIPRSEQILIIAHSNQALNDFFSKILASGKINEAEIVRLGQGQREAETSGAFQGDFSRNGRVNFLLQRRIALLKEVELMAKWLEARDAKLYAGLSGSASYSCENALHFYQFYIKDLVDNAKQAEKLTEDVLLKEYFASRTGTPPKELTEVQKLASDIEAYFGELNRLQPFELLQTTKQQGEMYLVHHARIVAMTCTHAALNHAKLVKLGLTFGSLVMEEAGQVSEIDALIPLLLAYSSSSSKTLKTSTGSSNLKRVVLMGDPKQLPPIVKSMALKNYARLDQSLFTRLLRLGVPHIMLDQQGRSRSSLADLYRWRYNDSKAQLGDLMHVTVAPAFQNANAGFASVAQMIHLPNANERQVRPFAYENEEEARFLVALFKYMLTIGYKAETITMLTTYNAQKDLLQQLLRAESSLPRCKVSTVDRFQGQQNDYILLSTVRSGASVGHLRDVRRATTAFSRARLGLYIVGNEKMFSRCKELEPFFTQLRAIAGDHGTQLTLIPSEQFGSKSVRKIAEPVQKGKKKKSDVQVVEDRKQLEQLVANLSKTSSK